jgi:hypothetical protein
MKFYLSLLTALFICVSSYSQDVRVEFFDPPIPYYGNVLGDWGTDLIVSNTEPMGPVSGIMRGDTIFVALPDTVGAPTGALRILKSSNNGANWSVVINVTGVGSVTKTRMVKSGLDTVYCTFALASSAIYILRVNLPLVDPLRQIFTGGYRDFDCWASSTGGYYVFVDSLASTNLPRLASTNGGITWSQRAVVSSTGANPYCMKSLTGDTTILMYYRDPFAADTTTQGITLARYRESAPGTLSSIAFIQPLIPAGLQHDQFAGVLAGSTGWVVYTEGAPGSRNLMLLTTINNGTAWSAPVALTAGTADKYWFDILPYGAFSGGLDMIYYSDSTGGPSNTTDKIMYTNATIAAPGAFGSAIQISQFYPQFSTRGYKPVMIEYNNSAGDVAALWVGVDGANKRLFFDRLNAITSVNQNQNGIPEAYSLSQNYPNPFNPATKIEFAIPKNSLVTMKMYDILGREVAVLLNREMAAGSYTINYDASALPSGVYFYKITSGDFSDTKKMMLVK